MDMVVVSPDAQLRVARAGATAGSRIALGAEHPALTRRRAVDFGRVCTCACPA